MDEDISTTPTTETPASELSSTLGGSSTLVYGSGDNTPTIVYILLGVGAVAPVVLLLTIAIVLRSRRAARRAVRRRATYNSATTVDAVIDAWNSSITGGTLNSKPTVAGATDGRSSRSNLTAGGGQEPGILSELAVREFFDVQDRQACQLYVSVEPSEGTRSAKSGEASFSTAASSTPGSGDWSGSSEISGVMERRVEDLVALIGPASVATKNVPETVVDNTANAQLQTSSDDVPPILTTDSTVAESVPDSCLKNGQNGSYPVPATDSGPRVQTVVVDVEPPRVNGFSDEIGGYVSEEINDVDDGTPPLPCLSKMRRSEACYNIAHLSASSPVNVPDGTFDSLSKSSSPLPSPAPPTSAAVYSWNDTETEPTEDLISEEEQALQCLDAIAYDYAYNEDYQEPAVKRSKL